MTRADLKHCGKIPEAREDVIIIDVIQVAEVDK